MRHPTIAGVSLAAGLLVLAGCVPDRNNASDPALRPEARASVYVLVPVGAPMDGNVVVENLPYRTVLASAGPGGAKSLFLVDARESSDPNSSFSSLTFSFDLNGDDTFETVPAGFNQCPSPAQGGLGEPGACRVYRPEELQAVLGANGLPVRNAPIPVVVRVADEKNRRHDVTVEIRVNDTPPRADGGADYVLPLKTCAAGPDCTHDVFLDGSSSSDIDPVAAGEDVDLRAYCWEEIPALAAACLPASEFVVGIPSPEQECAPAAVAGCSHIARSLTAKVGAALVNGLPPHARFRLHVKDRYAWSTPDPVELRIEQGPLWFLRNSPPVAYRYAGGSYRLSPGTFLGNGGGILDPALFPLVANGPDGDFGIFLMGEDQNTWFANRFDRNGVSFFAYGPSNQGYTLRPEVAAHDGNGLLWAAFLPVDDLATNPNNAFVTATTGGNFALGVGEYSSPATDVAFKDVGRLSFMVVAPDKSAIAATRGGTELLRFTLIGGGKIGVARTTGFAGIRGIEIAPDGRVFVSDAGAIPAEGTIRIFAPDGVEGTPITGLGAVDAMRFEPAENALWVNAADMGLWIVPLVPPAVRERVSDPLGEAAAVRVTRDGFGWVASRGTNEVWRITPPLAALPEPILTGGVNSGASGILFDGAPLMSFRTIELEGGEVLRLPPFGSILGGASPPVGAFRDASTDRDRGGAWQAFAEPPQVFQSTTEGDPLSATAFSALDVGGISRSLDRPWRISADPVTRALWVLDNDPTDFDPLVETRWLLATRAPIGSPAVPTGVAYDTRPGEVVYRLRAAGGTTDPAAWSYVEIPQFGTRKIVYVKRNGTGFTRTEIFANYPMGPAVTGNGTAWFAKAQAPGSAFNIDAFPTCDDANTASQCLLGTRLGFATPGATAVTAFVPPGVDLGNCSGGPCSVIPLDVAYDIERNDLWLAAVDHGDGGAANIFRFWRFSCVTATALQSCSAANIRTVTWPTLSDIPLSTSFDMDLFFFAGENPERLLHDFPDLLGVDPGTGDAYFLEPLTGRVNVLHVTETPTPRMQRVGFFPTDGMTRTAIGR